MPAPQGKRVSKAKHRGSPAIADLPAQHAVENAARGSAGIPPEEIARLAHSYWESRGCQGGSPEEDWLRAERQLRVRQ
jgi:hypothetical protein